jgi:hypothetical protein
MRFWANGGFRSLDRPLFHRGRIVIGPTEVPPSRRSTKRRGKYDVDLLLRQKKIGEHDAEFA